MTDGVHHAEHRWHQSGGFAWLVVAILVAGVALYIRLAPKGATQDDQLSFTFNPNALQQASVVNVDVRSTDDPRFGNPQAKVTVVEFGDFQCPYCRQVFPTVRELMNRYQDQVLFIYRDYPVADTHQDAAKAAEAGQCAWEQGSNQFWSLHDRMFLGQNDLSAPTLKKYAAAAGLDSTQFDACLDAGKYATEVVADYDDGLAAGVRGTPTFFINGRRFEGPLPLDQFAAIINASLNP